MKNDDINIKDVKIKFGGKELTELGDKFEPIDTGLKVQPYDWEHKIVKTLPTKTVK